MTSLERCSVGAMLLALFGCVPMVTVMDMEPELDRMIGKPLPKSNHPIEYAFERREVDGEKYELVSHRPDQCNYVLSVKALDNTITGWRFLLNPPPKGCRFQQVRQLM